MIMIVVKSMDFKMNKNIHIWYRVNEDTVRKYNYNRKQINNVFRY